ncbi:MAG: amidohydrolase family protein, partial [Xanthomonadales bacterium]|nr:amidohydrolase family protein [Xanthomonadales bacterium]
MKTCLAVLLGLLALPAAAETVVLAPVNVVYVTQGVIARDMAVRVSDGEIVAVGEAAGMDTQGVRVIDGQGGYLLPGLAEMHAHVPPMSDEQRVRDVLSLFLANGITTIRGMLGEPGHLGLRDALEQQQDWIGPRLITSGPSFNGNSVTSAEQAARRAREQAKTGYDFLKLHPGLELDEFLAIDGAADAAGIPYAGHVSQAVGLEQALRAQQATIDHLDGYLQALVPADHPRHGGDPGFFGLSLADAADASQIPGVARDTAAAGVWNVPTEALMVH